jgi:hypothetical protein
MLTDSIEIKIISEARQKNVRDPNRSREHFKRIFDDFFREYSFNGKYWLDLGPGQFDFGELARLQGAVIHSIDNDEAVIKLGEYKKFITFNGNLKKFLDLSLEKNFYDGVFCKFSINAFWFYETPEKIIPYISSLCEVLNENGSAWIAPWNGIPKKADLNESQISRLLELQIKGFSEQGFDVVEITQEKAIYYGINGIVANNIIFTKNI